MVHLFIDSHGCGRSRDVVYGVDIDQFEDLSQNIEVDSEKQGVEGRPYLSHRNSLSLVSQGESAQLRVLFVRFDAYGSGRFDLGNDLHA